MKRFGFLKISMILCAFVFCSGLKAQSEPLIDGIDLYLINVDVKRHFSFGDWNSRQHVVVRVRAGDYEGWGEGVFSLNKPELNLENEAEKFRKAIGKSPSQVLEDMSADRKYLPWNPYEALNMALWDIEGKIAKKPVVRLWGLDGTTPVNGMFCILENDPDMVEKQALVAKKEGLINYIKLKIFGNAENDAALVKRLRQSMGEDCVIVADANHGYKNFANLKELADTLKTLKDSGLDAIEDPAKIDDSQMIELSKLCKNFGLSLIPDVNLRPSWRALAESPKGMGDYYNLHPGCMGDMLDMSEFAKKINSWGTKIMVGDNSLVGPACTVYQQFAIASGASWVEALEKPQESSVFLECVKSSSTYRTPQGLYAMRELPGWGLEVDVEKLKAKASRTATVE